MIFFARFFWFLYHFMQQLPHTENISFLNFVVFFFFIQFGESIYDPPRSKIPLLTFIRQQLDWIENKIALIDVSKLIWYLERSDSKSSLTTIFAISYHISSILSLLECITRSSSTFLEEIKLAAILLTQFSMYQLLED